MYQTIKLKKWTAALIKSWRRARTKSSAIAICYDSVVGGKSLDDAMREFVITDAVKIGARNSRADLGRIQAAHDTLVDLGAECKEPEDEPPMDEEKTLITWGGEVKALAVVRSAKLYLALKILMKKYDATAMAFHIRYLIPDPRPADMVFPALATSEFQLENKVAKCQSHLNIVLSEMLLQYSYRRPSMLGDYSVDTYNNTSCVQHCEGPWNPWGDDRRVPYILTDHRERRVRAMGIGVDDEAGIRGHRGVRLYRVRPAFGRPAPCWPSPTNTPGPTPISKLSCERPHA